MFFILALITACVGVIPLLVARDLKTAAVAALCGTGILHGFYYLMPPMLVYPLWGGVGVYVLVLWALCVAYVSLRNERPSSLIIFPAFALLCFVGRCGTGCGAFRADDYAGMIGEVKQREWTKDIQPKDPNHIRLVPYDLACWLADKQLGDAESAVGSQFTIDKPRMTIQMIQGELWYVAPLDFRGFGAWSSAHASPGYVMVSGEDPHRQPVLKMGEKFAYTPGAFFNHNLERHLWMSGYAWKGLTDYSFEVDDELRPWWVVTVYEPTIAWSGERIKGVVVVNPTDGTHEFHAADKIPAWIDRAVPEEFVKDYVTWRGEYHSGWLNSWWYGLNITVPQTPTFIHGSDGEPYWVTEITSNNRGDQSLFGLMYTDARTGKSVFYRAKGSIDEAVLAAVNNRVTYKHLHGDSPMLYNMYGTMASIVPLLGESGTFQGVAIARVDNIQNAVAIGDDFATALREYQKLLAGTTGATPQLQDSTVSLSGTVERFSADVREKETTYYMTISGVQRIFTGGTQLSPKLALTRPGDQVSLTVIPSDEPVVPILSFNNETIADSGPIPGAAQ